MQDLHNQMCEMILAALFRRDPDFARHDLLKTANLLDWYAIAMREHAAGNVKGAETALNAAYRLCQAYEESYQALQEGAVLAPKTGDR